MRHWSAWSLLAAALAGPGIASAEPSQNLVAQGYLCAEATTRAERAEAIPPYLLAAISRAESGRWDEDSRENFAWPWTVTAGGEGEFHPTKAAAMARVRQLKAEGRTNIDVGCMQVNLRYHPDAFLDLEQAFDPVDNARYAADFLKRLYDRTGSWTEAAGTYHSSDKARARRYRIKVVRHWNEVRREARKRPATTVAGLPKAPAESRYESAVLPRRYATVVPPRQPGAGGDAARTEALNTRLRAERAASRGYDKAMKRHQEISSWRRARVQGLNTNHVATMRRAQAELRDKLRNANIGRSDFADRRRDQLGEWRRRQGYDPESDGGS
jgi:hypothetical protein